MGRLLLLAVGVVGGAAGVRRAQRAVQAYSPSGLTRRAGSRFEQVLADAKEFAADVREGMAEREQELRVALEVDAGSMDEATARELLENPSAPRTTQR